MIMSRKVWLWHSPDGVMVFGTAQRAMKRISLLYAEVTTWQMTDEEWYDGFEPGDSDARFSVYAEEVN